MELFKIHLSLKTGIFHCYVEGGCVKLGFERVGMMCKKQDYTSIIEYIYI